MSRTKLIVAGVVGLVVVAGVALWGLGFFNDTPEAASVEAAAAAVESEAADTAGDDAGSDETGDQAGLADTSDAAIDNIDGTWTVQQNEEATFVGYRINEVLTTIGDFEVVGRTGDVTGSMEASGTQVSAVSLVAQMDTLSTDSSRRDGAMRSQALETDTFPEATFELTAPIELGSIPAPSETISVTATGDLTIHGVTQSVDFPLDALLVGESIVVAGQLDTLLTDFGINPPQAPIVAGVDDAAVLELSLVFSR